MDLFNLQGGTYSKIKRRQQTAMMTWNQKMERHPSLSESAPPIAGAIQGES